MKLTSALIILAFAMLTAHAQTNLSSKDPDESSGVSGANLERMPESLEVRFELSAVAMAQPAVSTRHLLASLPLREFCGVC